MEPIVMLTGVVLHRLDSVCSNANVTVTKTKSKRCRFCLGSEKCGVRAAKENAITSVSREGLCRIYDWFSFSYNSLTNSN
jgi:hypothetical protein